MKHRIIDKILIVIISTAAIVLAYEDVTAVHVLSVLSSIIILATDEIIHNNYSSYIMAIAMVIGMFINPAFLFCMPAMIYVLVRHQNKSEYIVGGIILLLAFFTQATTIALMVTLVMTLVFAYMSFSTAYYENKIMRSTSMFDEARQEAYDNARKRREMRDKADNEVYTARLKERNRIAREIHDNVGHQITRVIVQMQAIKIINKDPVVGQQLDSVSETLDLAMTGIRRSVHELHDDSIDLAIGINDIAKTLPDKFKVDVSTSIDSPANNEVKTAILGIIKEAVTNIAKHSNGDKVKIEVIENVSFWRLFVHDNGKCPDKEYSLSSAQTSDGHGIGLSNIYDRANGINGRVAIRSSKSGFEVLVTIPKKE